MRNAGSILRACILMLAATLIPARIVLADDTTGFFAGKIEAIDVPQRSLGVKNTTSAMLFKVAADAKIIGADKKTLALTDLKVGQEVTVDYTREDGLAVAHTITLKEIIPPPLPPEPKPAPL